MTGKVFAHLFENFPAPMNLTPGRFIEGGPDAVFDTWNPHGGLMTEAQFFIDTVFWLMQEKYIDARNPSRADNALYMATLTDKGLAVLRSVPDSLQNKVSLGERLVASAKSGAIEAIKMVTREILSVAVKTISIP